MQRYNCKYVLSAIVIFLITVNAFSSNYPLEITNIKPVGTGTPAISSGNRIFKAYPGIPYNIRAAVIGGLYPYTFSLIQKPDGMTIIDTTGEINWPNPQNNTEVTLMVTDSEKTQVIVTWAITVTKVGFIFIDSSAAISGDGSLEKPFKCMLDMMGKSKTDETYKNYIVYFRKGTYALEGYYDNPEDPTRITFYDKPTVWLEYPGEKVILDFKRQNIGQWTKNIYYDGFDIKNCGNYGFDAGGDYSTYRRLYFSNLIDIKGGNNNQSFLRLNGGGFGTVIQDCIFDTTPKCDVKLYDHVKCLIENNTVINNIGGEGFAVKMGNDTVIIRGNKIDSMPNGAAITVDAYKGDGAGCRNIEILRNKISGCYKAMVLGANGALGSTYVYENEIDGVPSVRFVKSSEGPVIFSNNEITNAVEDNGVATSNCYYRGGVLFDNSPNIFESKVEVNNIIIGYSPVKKTSAPLFLSKGNQGTSNSIMQSYDICGRKIMQSGKHLNATVFCITKETSMLNTKRILWKN